MLLRFFVRMLLLFALTHVIFDYALYPMDSSLDSIDLGDDSDLSIDDGSTPSPAPTPSPTPAATPAATPTATPASTTTPSTDTSTISTPTPSTGTTTLGTTKTPAPIDASMTDESPDTSSDTSEFDASVLAPTPAPTPAAAAVSKRQQILDRAAKARAVAGTQRARAVAKTQSTTRSIALPKLDKSRVAARKAAVAQRTAITQQRQNRVSARSTARPTVKQAPHSTRQAVQQKTIKGSKKDRMPAKNKMPAVRSSKPNSKGRESKSTQSSKGRGLVQNKSLARGVKNMRSTDQSEFDN